MSPCDTSISTLDCPATGAYHHWRPASKRHLASCRDCRAFRCAGRVGRGVRCPYPAVAYPADVPSCPDHAGNPGGIAIN